MASDLGLGRSSPCLDSNVNCFGPTLACPLTHPLVVRPLSDLDLIAGAIGADLLEEHGCMVVDVGTPDELPVRASWGCAHANCQVSDALSIFLINTG